MTMWQGRMQPNLSFLQLNLSESKLVGAKIGLIIGRHHAAGRHDSVNTSSVIISNSKIERF